MVSGDVIFILNNFIITSHLIKMMLMSFLSSQLLLQMKLFSGMCLKTPLTLIGSVIFSSCLVIREMSTVQ